MLWLVGGVGLLLMLRKML